MVILGGWAFSYERGTPAHVGGGSTGRERMPGFSSDRPDSSTSSGCTPCIVTCNWLSALIAVLLICLFGMGSHDNFNQYSKAFTYTYQVNNTNQNNIAIARTLQLPADSPLASLSASDFFGVFLGRGGWGFRFGIWGLGLRIEGLGLRVEG